MGQPVVHFEIKATDLDRSSKFYSDVFGWNIQPMPEMQYGMADISERGINGGLASNADHPGVVVYIEVPDLNKALEQVEKAGGKTLMEPVDIPGVVSFAQFQDPGGNVVGLVKGE